MMWCWKFATFALFALTYSLSASSDAVEDIQTNVMPHKAASALKHVQNTPELNELFSRMEGTYARIVIEAWLPDICIYTSDKTYMTVLWQEVNDTPPRLDERQTYKETICALFSRIIPVLEKKNPLLKPVLDYIKPLEVDDPNALYNAYQLVLLSQHDSLPQSATQPLSRISELTKKTHVALAMARAVCIGTAKSYMGGTYFYAHLNKYAASKEDVSYEEIENLYHIWIVMMRRATVEEFCEHRHCILQRCFDISECILATQGYIAENEMLKRTRNLALGLPPALVPRALESEPPPSARSAFNESSTDSPLIPELREQDDELENANPFSIIPPSPTKKKPTTPRKLSWCEQHCTLC